MLGQFWDHLAIVAQIRRNTRQDVHIRAKTCKYMQIRANMCKYAQMRAYMRRYTHLRAGGVLGDLARMTKIVTMASLTANGPK